MRVAFMAAACALLLPDAPLHSQMPGPLPADHVGASRPALSDVFAQDTLDRTPHMIGGGLLGGTLGLALGGFVGYGLETRLRDNCYDYCGLGGAILGGVVGESLGMAFGVHAGNRQRGSYGAAVVGPIGVALGAIVLGSAIDGAASGVAIAVAVPALQLYTSIRGERGAARRRTAPPDP